MSVKTINEFVEEVLTFHPSRSTFSKLLLPKVLLKRLPNKTIQEYTGMKKKLESSPSSPESPCYNSMPILEDEKRKERQEDNLDSTSSSSSDDLPNLNDPSWDTCVKKKELKKKMKKDNKPDAKLMINARKLFQQQASRYKSSQDFVKISKASKIQNSERRSELDDHMLSNTESQSLSYESSPSHTEALSAQTTEETDDEDSESSSSRSVQAEKMNIKLREAMAKCVGQRREVITGSKDQSLNTTSTVSDTADFTENIVSSDSNDSNCTVIFDGQVEEIYPIESVTSLSNDDIEVITLPHEKNNKKRKDSPSKSEESFERNKKSKKEDEQSKVREIDANKKPMVIIPTHVSPHVTSLSRVVTTFTAAVTTTSPAIVTSTPALETISTPSSLDMPNQITSQLGRKESEININDNLGEDSLETIPVSKDDDQKLETSTLNSLNEMVTTASNKNSENLQNDATNTVKKAPVSSSEKSLTPFNEFQELTLRRIECVEKIRQIKEEYEKKLEPLEKELKILDDEVKKLMIATTKWKDPSKEKHESVPDEQQGPTDNNSSGVEEITASPEQVNSTSMAPSTSTSESKNMEKTLINVIPAASIRNFGGKKIPTIRVLQKTSNQPQSTLNTAEGAVGSSHLQNKPYTRIAVRVPVTSIPSSNASGDCSTAVQYSLLDKQPPPNVVLLSSQQQSSVTPNRIVTSVPSSTASRDCPPAIQYSPLDKQPPPNVVLLSPQQQPAVTSNSSHIMCRVDPFSTTHVSQRQNPVGKKAIPGLISMGHTSTVMISQNQQSQNVPLQVQQNSQYLPLQLQQQQKMQQQTQLVRVNNPQQQSTQLQSSSNSHLPQQQPSISHPYVHQYQSTQGQPQHNMQLLQGHVVGGTYTVSVGSNNGICSTTQVTTIPANTIIATPFQQNSLTPKTNTNIQTQSCNPNSDHSFNFPQKSKPINPVTGNKVISLSLPSVSHASVVTGINDNNMIIPTQSKTQDPLSSKDVNQSAAEILSTSLSNSSNTAGSSLQHIESNQPICVRCGSDGIFICCNGVVYCSTTCQGNDWEIHQLKCTNSTMPEL